MDDCVSGGEDEFRSVLAGVHLKRCVTYINLAITGGANSNSIFLKEGSFGGLLKKEEYIPNKRI